MFDIDYVFPWVNDQDPVWQKTYIDYCKSHQQMDKVEKIHNCRYRDWGLLKYLFRAIAKNMPWIRKVHLIVSNKEQVPEWLNTDKVHIVLHEDIMPPEVLPTFNSGVIEMFFPYINDLSEHFIYANDDMYPWNLTQPLDWFTADGKLKCNMIVSYSQKCVWNKMISNVWWILQKRLNGQENKAFYLRPWHGLSPLRKTDCLQALELVSDKVLSSCSSFREAKNMTYYLYSDYSYLKQNMITSNLCFEYIRLDDFKEALLTLRNKKTQVVCLNDSGVVEARAYPLYKKYLKALMEQRFPEKCKYER